MYGVLAFVSMPGLGAVAGAFALGACTAVALLVALALALGSLSPRRRRLRPTAAAWGIAAIVLGVAGGALLVAGERAETGDLADPAGLVVPPLALALAALAAHATDRRLRAPRQGQGQGGAGAGAS